MKYAKVIILLLALTACTSGQNTKLSGSSGCQTKSFTANNQSLTTVFCIIETAMFQPAQVLVQVNKQTVFEGTTYKRVAFEKLIREGTVTGGCDENIQIQDAKTGQPVTLANLPKELTSGCKISANSNGASLPFKKDSACDEVYYNHLAPIIGEVVPVGLSQQCAVRLNNEVIFDGTFR